MILFKQRMILIVNKINYRMVKENNLYSPMQKWLNNNEDLMHSAHNEGKSVVVERFIKTLNSKIYKRMTANDSKSYLGYLNKLVQ